MQLYVDANVTEVAWVGYGEGVPKRTRFEKETKHFELEGIFTALKAQNDAENIELFNDDKGSIRFLRGDDKPLNKSIQEKCEQIWRLIKRKNLNVKFIWVPREENEAGNLLLRWVR